MNVKKSSSGKGPFIKKFRTKKNHYIYDVNSNELLKVNEIIYNIIDYLGQNDIEVIINKFMHLYKISEIKKAYDTFKKARTENNYLSNHRPEISFGFKSTNDIKNILKSNLGHLTLELTERCNQRCKYCAFSGRYKLSRTHGRKVMSFEIAKKAVDFFIKKSEGNLKKKPNIGFYGGEPLLEFELIKKIIDYIKYINKFEKYRFSLTTNGTLFNKKIIEYFVRNNIFITISLDGPADTHNRYRVFANGKSTFDIVMKNLNKIYEYSSEYYRKYITFNAVLAPPYDFERIINFFSRNPFIKEKRELINFSFVDPYETTFFKDFCLEMHEKDLYKEIEKLRYQYQDALIKGNYEDLLVEKKFFDRSLYNIDSRTMDFLGEKYPAQGTCFPGQRRLFINTDGKFFMCEKVNSNYEIGNVDNGFNYKKIYYFFEKFAEFFKDCKYCWALRLCHKCFNNIQKGDEFDLKRKNELCINNLYSIEKALICYCEIREKNIDAFKVFDNLKIM